MIPASVRSPTWVTISFCFAVVCGRSGPACFGIFQTNSLTFESNPQVEYLFRCLRVLQTGSVDRFVFFLENVVRVRLLCHQVSSLLVYSVHHTYFLDALRAVLREAVVAIWASLFGGSNSKSLRQPCPASVDRPGKSDMRVVVFFDGSPTPKSGSSTQPASL